MDYTLGYEKLDQVFAAIREEVTERLLECSSDADDFVRLATQPNVVAEVVMQFILRGSKHDLVDVAEYLGPDLAQDLYKAVVFITKVA